MTPGEINSWICYPLYYWACLLLAFSPLVPRADLATAAAVRRPEGSVP